MKSTAINRLDTALHDASCEAEQINILADDIVRQFHARYDFAGCSIERAAMVDHPYVSLSAYRLARAKLVAEIESGWGRDAASRWDAALAPLWG